MRADTFDAVFWKSVHDAFDQALEMDATERDAYLAQIAAKDARCADETRKLLHQTGVKPAAVEVAVNATPANDAASVSAAAAAAAAEEKGFDHLLHRALHAERMRERSARYRGEMCGPWKLEQIIGTGGMGEVWLAMRADGLYEGRVAVKFLHTDVDLVRFEARFTQERALLARLHHPGIARLLDAGKKFGTPYLVIEYVDGTPLLDYVAKSAPTVAKRVELIRSIGGAVAYAHSQLVVHRDIKPSNIFVTLSGEPKLLDFGVAGLLDSALLPTTESPATKVSGRGLTLEYAAPEQITGEPTGVATDVYCLGALAFHMLSGQRAHLPTQPGRAALEYAILHLDPLRVSDAARLTPPSSFTGAIAPPIDALALRGDIDAIIARALRRNPLERYATVADMVADLRRWSEHRPISARHLDWVYRTWLWVQRNKLAVGLSASLFVALTAGLATSLVQYKNASDEANRASKTVAYMGELLSSVDPDLNAGKVPTVTDLLDRAARETPERFADDAATQVELTRLFAVTYRSLNRDAAALPLAKRALQLAAAQHGARGLPTLRAGRLLAEIQYWSNDFQVAVTTLAPIMPQLAATLSPTSLEMIETQQSYASMLCAVYRADEAEKILADLSARVGTLGLSAELQQWTAADLDAGRARCYGRVANWPAALLLLRKHATTYANPPIGKTKQGLLHQGYTVSVQNILGDPTGVETALVSLMERWRALAGNDSERIDELLSDLGLYHQHRMDADAAEKTYRIAADRMLARDIKETTEQLRPKLDLLEVRTIFNRAPVDDILRELDAMIKVLLRDASPDLARFRQNLLRASIIAVSLERLDIAERYMELARTLGQDKAPASLIRELQAQSYLLRARGDHGAAVTVFEKRIASFEQRGEKVSLRRALLGLSYGYELWLRDPNDKQRILEAMREAVAAAPPSLPQDNRFFVQFNWLQTLVSLGEQSPEHRLARAAVAKLFGRNESELPRVLNGFFLI